MLRLSPDSAKRILQHAQEKSPEECCGILIGLKDRDTRIVHDVIACENTADDRRCRYSIDSSALIAAQKAARESGAGIVGFYHSHPQSGPKPSQTDAELAYWTECSYLIAGRDGEKDWELRSFRCEMQRLVPEPLTLQ